MSWTPYLELGKDIPVFTLSDVRCYKTTTTTNKQQSHWEAVPRYSADLGGASHQEAHHLAEMILNGLIYKYTGGETEIS